MKPTPDSRAAAKEINRLHAVAVRMAVDSRNSLRRALSAAWRAGGLLIEAKKHVRRRMGRGAWLPWLEQNFEGSARTAQRYMCLARCITESGSLVDLSLRQAYFRLGISTEPKSRRDAIPVAALPEPVRLASRLVEVLRATPAEGYCEDLRPLFEQLRSMFEQANNLPASVSIPSPWQHPAVLHVQTKACCVV
jgi:hypothetical protein